MATLGHSPAHQRAQGPAPHTSAQAPDSGAPGLCSQSPWDPAPPISRQVPALEPLALPTSEPALDSGLPSPSSRWAAGPGQLQPHSLWIQPRPAGQHQPWDWLSPVPAHQKANTSFETAWALQPAVSGTSPTHDWPNTSSETLGHCSQTPRTQICLPVGQH